MQFLMSRLTLNAAIVALLVGSLVVQTVRIEGFKVWPLSHKGLKAELAEMRQTLQGISSDRNEQLDTTGKNIGIANERIIYRDRVIRPLESKPIGENPRCETPDLQQWREIL